MLQRLTCKFLILGAAFGLSGCLQTGINENPAPMIAANSYTKSGGEFANTLPWFESFGDQTLNNVMTFAFQNNLDVAQALARLDQAMAQSRNTRTELLPQVNLESSSEKSWEDGDPQEGFSEASLAMGWEIDAFGRIRAGLASDKFLERAAAEDVEAVKLALSADIATNYFQAIAQNKIIALLREQEKLDNQLYDLITLRYKEGVGTRLEQLQQESQRAETRSLIPDFEARQRLYENRLDVLMGLAPDGKDRIVQESKFALPADPLPVGVPADLLLNRPDLRALKNKLIAADADIEAAFAERLPRLMLDGSFLLSDAAMAVNPAASLLGSLMQPLLDWGARKAEVERNEAIYREQLTAFSQAYLLAIEDVETTLYQEIKQREYIARLEERRKLLSETVENSKSVYTQGLSDYLPVLSALQDLRAVERDIIAERAELMLLRIRLYRALGGSVSPQELKQI
jgi:NodT family efflux transporter outer membrane factor (OMF) lipoprotein